MTLACLLLKRKLNYPWKDNFHFLTLISTKLRNTLAQNSLDKLMQLTSMEPHTYDLDRGEVTDLHKFLKKPHRVVLSWCNLTYLKILKLKFTLFLVTFYCGHVTWWQHFTTLVISVFFSPFLSHHKIPNCCLWFLWKAPWTDQRPEMVSFCKITRLSSKETLLQA